MLFERNPEARHKPTPRSLQPPATASQRPKQGELHRSCHLPSEVALAHLQDHGMMQPPHVATHIGDCSSRSGIFPSKSQAPKLRNVVPPSSCSSSADLLVLLRHWPFRNKRNQKAAANAIRLATAASPSPMCLLLTAFVQLGSLDAPKSLWVLLFGGMPNQHWPGFQWFVPLSPKLVLDLLEFSPETLWPPRV